MTTEIATHKSLDLTETTTGNTFSFVAKRLVIAGFTGRDRDATQRHIAELGTQGVPAPQSVPAYYEVSTGLLDQSKTITLSSANTSGEAEPVLFCSNGQWYVGVGSDHTDRKIEREDIAQSKAACPKPYSTHVVSYPELRGRWDHLTLRSYADGGLYQEAGLDELLPLEEIVAGLCHPTQKDTDGLVMFCGTVPLLTGNFVYAGKFSAELCERDNKLAFCSYEIVRRSS
jgi:hypothetical protein